MKLKRWKIVAKYRNVKYYRNCATHTVSTKTDLMQCLSNIRHSGATWVPITIQEKLEVLTFVAPECEIEKLKQHLPKVLGVMEIKKK